MGKDELGPQERRVLRRLRTPERIQRFLDDEVGYNNGPASFRSPRRVLRDRLAHCLEGAMLAAAALEEAGYAPLLVDLEAVRDDDHVIAVFRNKEYWGAIAKSNYAGLRFRAPVYRTLRELVMSYFEHYYNPRGEKTLRAYSRPVPMTRFPGWRTAEHDLWEVARHLAGIPHYEILPGARATTRFQIDRRLYDAGRVGSVGQA